MKSRFQSLIALACIALAKPALAYPAPFDLYGPALRVSVTRTGTILPIASVPQLAAGDRVTVEATLPKDETAHYLLVAAFLRDSTNPPPDGWFAKSESWKSKGRGGGPITLIVPADARHLVLFLAPETRGDFSTLRNAVKARPGAFVRAAQDLEQASLDRGRYDAYLAVIRKVSASAPGSLAHVAPVVANSLHIKINDDCLQRQQEFQTACLLDAKQSVVLGSDGASDTGSLAGAATDLALSLSATPAAGLGYYSPYISTIHEIIGIFGAMRSAKFQYIPALGVPDGDKLALVLNTPPSFADPKSVMMAALPEVKPTEAPALQALPAAVAPCLGVKEAVLPLAVGPHFYATAYARDLMLRVHLPKGPPIELPLTADPARGGLVIGSPAVPPTGISGSVTARVHGQWGFDPLLGPEVTLQTAGDWHWQAKDAKKGEGPLVLTGAQAVCVSAVTATTSLGSPKPVDWKSSGPDEITITLPASGEKYQPVMLSVAGPEGVAPARVAVVPPAKAPPPTATIIAHSSGQSPVGEGHFIPILLDDPSEIPASTPLSFTLKAMGNTRFTGHETVEVGAGDGDAMARLTLGSGLVLVDPGFMVASLLPAQALGASAFGPLRARLLRDGVSGEWLNLGTLVRLPRLSAMVCPADPNATCTISGDGLYLLASVSASRDFEGATSISEGYPGSTLQVPHPLKDGILFVRLHDAPELVNRIQILVASSSEIGRIHM